MSIAEKLITIADNVQKVYEAGYTKGVSESGGGSYEEGFVDGQKAERDTFWDAYQREGIAMDYSNAFNLAKWTDDNYKPKYPIICTNAYSLFNSSKITDTLQDIDLSACVKSTSTQYAFGYVYSLITIKKLILSGNTIFKSTFEKATALENLTIEGTIGQDGFNVQWSTKLSKASIISIINALSSATSGLSITLSKTAVNNAFGIDVDDTSTWGEGTEYYTLRHSKDNWTITYI